MVRRAVARSSLRRVAEEIGVSHGTIADFAAKGSKRQLVGTKRELLIEWGERSGLREAGTDRLSYFQGKQDALLGMMRYITTQQEEIATFLGDLRVNAASSERPPTPTVDEAEEEAAIARQLPDPPAPAQKKEKRRA